MTELLTCFGLALPWAVGYQWLSAFTPHRQAQRPWLCLGYGFFIGFLLTGASLRLLDGVGIELTRTTVSTVLFGLYVLAWVLHKRLRGDDLKTPTMRSAIDNGMTGTVLCGLLLLLIATHLALIALEISQNPGYSWDASIHWARQAKMWWHHGALIEPSNSIQWLTASDATAYHDHYAQYPRSVPLFQLWLGLAVGQWIEPLVNMPWLAAYLALLLAFYAQVRLAGASTAAALSFTYLLSSVPLINTHVALAGYADMFSASIYALAVMSLYRWSIERENWQLVLTGLLGLGCLSIKNEGLYWFLTLVPAVIVAQFPLRKALTLLAVSALGLLIALSVFPQDLQVAGYSLAQLDLAYRQPGFTATLFSLFMYSSWHLVFYFWLAALGALAITRNTQAGQAMPVFVAVGAAFLLILLLFSATNWSQGAVQLTAVSRITLQLVPATLFAIALACLAGLALENGNES